MCLHAAMSRWHFRPRARVVAMMVIIERHIAGQFCQTEIQDLRLALAGHKNICRLDITVDDAFLMCSFQSIHNLNGVDQAVWMQFERIVCRDPLPRSAPAASALPRAASPGMVARRALRIRRYRANVGMIQCRGRPCLSLEAPQRYGICWLDSSGKNLSATRRPNLMSSARYTETHAAATESIQEAIVRYSCSRQGKFSAIQHRADGRLQVIAGASSTGKQCFYFSPQFRISAAGFIEQAGAVTRIALCSTMK